MTIPAEPVKPDMKARRSSQLAMYSLYKSNSKLTEVLTCKVHVHSMQQSNRTFSTKQPDAL